MTLGRRRVLFASTAGLVGGSGESARRHQQLADPGQGVAAVWTEGAGVTGGYKPSRAEAEVRGWLDSLGGLGMKSRGIQK